MEFLMLILCVIPHIVTSITISSNGNSPEMKMIGGMMVDVQKGFVPMKTPKAVESTTKSTFGRHRKLNDTKLSINERYRRLIPYMTFYYANDIAPTTESYQNKNVEVEKAQIVEAQTIQQQQPKKIIYTPYRSIPRYQGNRLTQFNIASSNPVKVYYNKDSVPVHYEKISPNVNPLIQEHVAVGNQDYDQGRFVQKFIKAPSVPFSPIARKPYLNLNNNDDQANRHYYQTEKDKTPKFKLVPYSQTPPLKVVPPPQIYDAKKPIPVPVLVSNDQIYIKPRPLRPHYNYDNIVNFQQVNVRKIPAVVSENYYVKQPQPTLAPYQSLPEPEDGFKPIPNPAIPTEPPVTAVPLPARPNYSEYKYQPLQITEVQQEQPEVTSFRPSYYEYEVDPPAYKPEEYVPQNTVTLSDLLNSLQLNKSIPKQITKENVGSSIRTLLQVLNALKAMSQNEVEPPVLSTPKPFTSPVPEIQEMTPKSINEPVEPISDVDLNEEPYLAQVNTPSQHLDDIPSVVGTSQQFPPPVNSDDEGGTPGRPGVDYPILTTIPTTAFDCKTQRYKGFFADPETRCQVWHYCDLNGGQASFLCPNGTIFSQAALTCDWWFNVRCASTTQLYVLNESLYKYILPHSPKFPEDYSGPLVDKYLTLKFKEMEEQFRKNKKQKASEKSGSEETEDSSEDSSESDSEDTTKVEESEVSAVSEASVVVESPGTSGNVERLQDESS